jgi:cellulose synthase/poly-beta-1,6-N-acetylglucosamine synthase-like glycosyltransferase
LAGGKGRADDGELAVQEECKLMGNVSVVITTRNSAGTIGRCLDSLLPYQQNGLITDIIVVDSYSTDNTTEIIARYPAVMLQEEGIEAYQQSIIRVYHSTYHALDQGWQSSRGDIIMFLDSDAYVGEGMFPIAMEFFSDPQDNGTILEVPGRAGSGTPKWFLWLRGTSLSVCHVVWQRPHPDWRTVLHGA